MRGKRCFGRPLGAGVGVAITMLVAGCTGSSEPVHELRMEPVTETGLAGTVGTEVSPVPVVRLATQDGNPVSGVEIRFDVSDRGAVATASARTDGGGRATPGSWTLGPMAGAQTVTARTADVADVVFSATAGPGPVAKLTPVSGDKQTGLAGDPLPIPLRVKVGDRYGNAVSGAPVTFVVISGAGTIEGSAATTDALGMATSGAWRLGGGYGAQQVRADANGAHAVFTAFACDGACHQDQLLFVRGDRIYLLVAGVATPLTASERIEAEPAWSPDGRRIAFVRYDQALTAEIHLMDADGRNVVRRATGFRSPAWSPDGRQLAVARGFCVYECDIYLLGVESGGGAVHLQSMASQPAWSPDGTRIAFVSLSGDDGYHALYVMNADGTAVRAITPRDEGAIDHPTWSPDGRRIAFGKCNRGACNIVAVDADGSGAAQLTNGTMASHPAWSPDGTRIAFTSWADFAHPMNQSVAVVPAEGGEAIQLASPGHSPAWGP